MSEVPSQPVIQKEQFVNWRKDEVTKFIRNELQFRKDISIERVRHFVREGEYAKASYYEGVIEGLDTILDIEYEDVKDEV